MNVHFVLPQLVPTYGMEKAALALMQALSESGCSVSCCTLSGSVAVGGESPSNVGLDVNPGFFRLPRSVPVLRRHLMSLPPETHIVASGLWAALPVGCALTATGRDYVAWEHSVLPVRLRADRRVATLFRLLGQRTVRPRAVVAVSAGVQRAVLAAWRGAVVETIPNIVVTAPAPPNPKPDVAGFTRLVTTGALRPLKNNVTAIHALRYLPESFVLDLAGDGPQAESLRAETRAHGLADRVRFHGRIPDVRDLLKTADVLVHPSLVETFGFSLFEAADAGVPVAAFKVEAIDEIVPRYVPGALADEQSAAALAEVILALATGGVDLCAQVEAWGQRGADLAPTTVAHQWRSLLGGSDFSRSDVNSGGTGSP